jgi:RNA polymerase sigma factor
MIHWGVAMVRPNLESLLIEAHTNIEVRELIISRYKPYVINTVRHLCRRFVTWSDEESSLGLLALNRAIDTHRAMGGRSFTSYVFLLIKRDLIDYFRREQRHQHMSFDWIDSEEETSATVVEVERSIDQFERNQNTLTLVDEIMSFDQTLQLYDIRFEDLETHCPKHSDTRETLRKLAFQFVQSESLTGMLLEKKRFPQTDFIARTGTHPKTIERHRKYIIALILILLHPEWIYLTEYVKVYPK